MLPAIFAPGLSAQALYQSRESRATLGIRSILEDVLHDHLHVPAALEHTVFPESRAARPLQDRFT